MGKKIKVHYINDDQKRSFIVAKSSCGIHWLKCNDFTSQKKYVTCNKCNKLINNKHSKT